MEEEEECILLSEEGITSKAELDSRWHPRLERFREVENLFSTNVDDDTIKPTFTVPRIIVIGDESSGKSSTMERIAMMQFFPIDNKFCTRMPIELRLRYRNAEYIRQVYESNNCPVHDSYVKISVLSPLDSNLPPVEDVIFSPHEATTKIRNWMEQLTILGKMIRTQYSIISHKYKYIL